MLLAFDRIETPLGPMIAMAEERGLVLLEFLDRPALVAEIEELRARHGYVVAPGTSPHLEAVAGELQVPLHTPGSAFEVAVWNDLRAIPFGETSTYGEMAERLGRPGAAREVGRANGSNRIAIVVPCHRVIGADGSLVGYGGGKTKPPPSRAGAWPVEKNTGYDLSIPKGDPSCWTVSHSCWSGGREAGDPPVVRASAR